MASRTFYISIIGITVLLYGILHLVNGWKIETFANTGTAKPGPGAVCKTDVKTSAVSLMDNITKTKCKPKCADWTRFFGGKITSEMAKKLGYCA